MEDVIKRQHFVQRAYLDKFRNEEGYLYAYDKDKLTSFPAKPKDVANKHRFYDYPFEEDKRTQSIENKLSKLENIQIVSITSFINSINSCIRNSSFHTKVLNAEQKKELAHIIGLQFLRTLEHRKFISDFFQSTKHKLRQEAEEIHREGVEIILHKTPLEYKLLVENFLLETKERSIGRSIEYIEWLYSEGLPIIQGEDMFRRCKNLADILLSHIWVIGVNTFSKDKSFYTSDRPVAKTHPLYGVASHGVQISFPLNSEIILILFERQSYKQYEVFENKIIQLTTEQIDSLNLMQVILCNRQVYCRDDNFNLVERVLKSNSYDLSSGKRRC